MQRRVKKQEDKLKTCNAIGTKPTNGKPMHKLWDALTFYNLHVSQIDKTDGEKIRSAREKVTQAINLANIQFHSNYESTMRKLKRFIRVEKVLGGNFSRDAHNACTDFPSQNGYSCLEIYLQC